MVLLHKSSKLTSRSSSQCFLFRRFLNPIFYTKVIFVIISKFCVNWIFYCRKKSIYFMTITWMILRFPENI